MSAVTVNSIEAHVASFIPKLLRCVLPSLLFVLFNALTYAPQPLLLISVKPAAGLLQATPQVQRMAVHSNDSHALQMISMIITVSRP